VAALDDAQALLSRDIPPIPLPHRKKKPMIRGWQNLVLSAEELPQYFNGARQNIGGLNGAHAKGIVTIDLDLDAACLLAAAYLPATDAVVGRPGKPSSHLLFRADPLPKTRRLNLPDGRRIVELLSTGTQTVYPHSAHPSGETYQWEREGEPTRVNGDELTWAVRHLAAAVVIASIWPSKGSRHDFSNAVAGWLLNQGVGHVLARKLIYDAARAVGDEEAEARARNVDTTAAKIKDGEPVTGGPTLLDMLPADGPGALKRIGQHLGFVALVRNERTGKYTAVAASENADVGWDEGGTGDDGHDDEASVAEGTRPPRFALTDYGNAERLIAAYGRDLRYCYLWGKWLIWTGRRWELDETATVERWAKATVRAIYREAADTPDDKARDALVKHATKSECVTRIQAMVNLAQSELGIPARPDDFDADPWLFNVQNGTLDRRTGELRPHRREELITKIAAVEYAREAVCPTWLAFLDRVFGGNADLISFIRRATGYSMTGQTVEQVLLLLYGLGANGKSTLLEVVRATLGTYAGQADFATFLARDHDPVRNDIARLVGTRFVAAVEVEGGRRLAEVLVKTLTGGDTITARFLHREFFEFQPAFKLWLAANHRPVI
jgi:hypothetical protein